MFRNRRKCSPGVLSRRTHCLCVLSPPCVLLAPAGVSHCLCGFATLDVGTFSSWNHRCWRTPSLSCQRRRTGSLSFSWPLKRRHSPPGLTGQQHERRRSPYASPPRTCCSSPTWTTWTRRSPFSGFHPASTRYRLAVLISTKCSPSSIRFRPVLDPLVLISRTCCLSWIRSPPVPDPSSIQSLLPRPASQTWRSCCCCLSTTGCSARK